MTNSRGFDIACMQSYYHTGSNCDDTGTTRQSFLGNVRNSATPLAATSMPSGLVLASTPPCSTAPRQELHPAVERRLQPAFQNHPRDPEPQEHGKVLERLLPYPLVSQAHRDGRASGAEFSRRAPHAGCSNKFHITGNPSCWTRQHSQRQLEPFNLGGIRIPTAWGKAFVSLHVANPTLIPEGIKQSATPKSRSRALRISRPGHSH